MSRSDLAIEVRPRLQQHRWVSTGLAATLAALGVVAAAGAIAYGVHVAINTTNAAVQQADSAQQVIDRSSPLHTVTDIVSAVTEETKRLDQAKNNLAIAMAEQTTPAVQQNTAELQHWDYEARVARGQVEFFTQARAKLDQERTTVSAHLVKIASSYGITTGQVEHLVEAAGLTGKQLRAQGKAWQDALRQVSALALKSRGAGNG